MTPYVPIAPIIPIRLSLFRAASLILLLAILYTACGCKGNPERRIADLVDTLRYDTGEHSQRAADGLVAIGKPAVPALADALIENGAVNIPVANVLKRFGPDAEAAIPALLHALSIEPGPITEALISIGPAVIPYAIAAIRQPGTKVSKRVMYVLGQLGAPAMPSLLEVIKGGDADAAELAVEALTFIGPEGVAEYFRLLGNGEGNVQVAAAKVACFRIRHCSVPGFPEALLKAAKAQNKDVRVCAIRALGTAGPFSQEALDAAIGASKDADPDVRASAACTLGEFGLNSPAPLPALMAMLHDENVAVRRNAVTSLSLVAGRANEVLPALFEALQDEDPIVKQWAMKGIASVHTLPPETFGPTAQEALPQLEPLAQDQDKEVRNAAADAISNIEAH